jgi:hypothetical protein
MKKVFLISIISILFISCDSFVHINAKVVDCTTGEPIKNARITIWRHELYTDSLGNFSDETNTGRPTEIRMRIEKQGYKPFVIRYEEGKENYYFVKNIYGKINNIYQKLNSTSFEITKDSIKIKLEKIETNNKRI